MKSKMIILTSLFVISTSAFAFKGQETHSDPPPPTFKSQEQHSLPTGPTRSAFSNVETTADGKSIFKNVEIVFDCAKKHIVMIDQKEQIFYRVDFKLCEDTGTPLVKSACDVVTGDVEIGEVSRYFFKGFEVTGFRNLKAVHNSCGGRVR